MKTKFTFILSFIICVGFLFPVNAQSGSDKDNYWILENFNQFPIEDEWNILQKNYKTLPNDINLTTIYANIEQGFDCAYGQKALRIRGLEESGSAQFTVPNASRVIIHITGKQKAADRGVVITRNGVEVFKREGFDRYQCIEFYEEVNSQEELTYKITAADATKKDPMVLYYIEVQKYGVNIPKPETPQPNYDAYWIYEDFNNREIELDYNTKMNYNTVPANITLKTDSANIELGEGCSGGGGKKILRIRGKEFDGGKIEFTVPDAKSVSINVTGKSTFADRTINIYKNNVLVQTFEHMDRSKCEEYLDEEPSTEEVTYRVEGSSDTYKPVGITGIYVEKYDPTGINTAAVEKKETLHFYPNPSSDIIYFSEKVLSAFIYDLKGKALFKAENTEKIDVSRLNKGIYIVRLTTQDGAVTQKLIKE
ncbi:MAG: T9SS type A sorting domain-containing protein [Dysgonamonadaceae bacterium]|jgi:hypothetical protein|nr:T9SS type A sorting domain-containing protein [Dysgonamonadaceae bacterium]